MTEENQDYIAFDRAVQEIAVKLGKNITKEMTDFMKAIEYAMKAHNAEALPPHLVIATLTNARDVIEGVAEQIEKNMEKAFGE